MFVGKIIKCNEQLVSTKYDKYGAVFIHYDFCKS